MSDEIPMLTGILGAFRAGLVAVPVSTMFTGAELGKIMADSGARAVLATPEFADAVSEARRARRPTSSTSCSPATPARPARSPERRARCTPGTS